MKYFFNYSSVDEYLREAKKVEVKCRDVGHGQFIIGLDEPLGEYEIIIDPPDTVPLTAQDIEFLTPIIDKLPIDSNCLIDCQTKQAVAFDNYQNLIYLMLPYIINKNRSNLLIVGEAIGRVSWEEFHLALGPRGPIGCCSPELHTFDRFLRGFISMYIRRKSTIRTIEPKIVLVFGAKVTDTFEDDYLDKLAKVCKLLFPSLKKNEFYYRILDGIKFRSCTLQQLDDGIGNRAWYFILKQIKMDPLEGDFLDEEFTSPSADEIREFHRFLQEKGLLVKYSQYVVSIN